MERLEVEHLLAHDLSNSPHDHQVNPFETLEYPMHGRQCIQRPGLYRCPATDFPFAWLRGSVYLFDQSNLVADPCNGPQMVNPFGLVALFRSHVPRLPDIPFFTIPGCGM